MTENKQSHLWDIWVAKFPLLEKETKHCQYARRPVIIVSAEPANERVTVVPLSASLELPQRATHIYLDEPGLSRPSRTLCEFVSAIPVENLLKRIGYVDDSFSRYAIRHALSQHLQLPELVNW